MAFRSDVVRVEFGEMVMTFEPPVNVVPKTVEAAIGMSDRTVGYPGVRFEPLVGANAGEAAANAYMVTGCDDTAVLQRLGRRICNMADAAGASAGQVAMQIRENRRDPLKELIRQGSGIDIEF